MIAKRNCGAAGGAAGGRGRSRAGRRRAVVGGSRPPQFRARRARRGAEPGERRGLARTSIARKIKRGRLSAARSTAIAPGGCWAKERPGVESSRRRGAGLELRGRIGSQSIAARRKVGVVRIASGPIWLSWRRRRRRRAGPLASQIHGSGGALLLQGVSAIWPRVRGRRAAASQRLLDRLVPELAPGLAVDGPLVLAVCKGGGGGGGSTRAWGASARGGCAAATGGGGGGGGGAAHSTRPCKRGWRRSSRRARGRPRG